MNTISCSEFWNQGAKDQALLFIDVRTPGEFSSVHAERAVNIPLDSLATDPRIAQCGKDRPIALICQSGGRSRRAMEQLRAAGFQNVSDIGGGTAAWIAAGLPVERGDGIAVMSLERQVRIAAGALVLLGIFLGFNLSSSWFYLSGFVGAGLVFAGLTDYCGMALLLAKAPWNQSSKSGVSPK